ncbi:MAG: hypothetical protein LBI63_04390, partial [Candidatus Ancillula sp.]|nr:hypothetical protein [Candidatus Ancillula sp.]
LPKTDDDIKLENDGFPFKGRIVADETWGVTDPEYARVYGYVSGFIAHYDYLGTGIAANAPASWPKASPEIQAIVRKRSDGSVPNPDHQKALEECEKSMPSLHGGTDFGTDKNISVSNQVGELRMKIKEMAMRDERLEPELKIWSNCMKEKGFNFEYPPTSKIAGGGNEINGDNHLDIYGGDANELLATADAQCKQKQPEFLNTWHKILDDVEERELKNNLALFEEEKAYTDQLKKNAQDFIDKFSAENG